MAMANIKLTCKTCGETFEHTHYCHSRDEADRYEEWAKDNIDACPKCYRASKFNDCKQVEMSYSDYKNNYSDCKTVADSYNKEKKTIVVYVSKRTECIKEFASFNVEKASAEHYIDRGSEWLKSHEKPDMPENLKERSAKIITTLKKYGF